jgi:hypothetical protein
MYTPHSLRHSFKNLVNAGVSLEKSNPGRSLKPGDYAPVCEPSLQDLQKAVEMVSEED